jgi:hypothetical protein
MTKTEAGQETLWDTAFREGRANGFEWIFGIPYRQAWLLSRDYWQPPDTWRVRLARWLLKQELP